MLQGRSAGVACLVALAPLLTSAYVAPGFMPAASSAFSLRSGVRSGQAASASFLAPSLVSRMGRRSVPSVLALKAEYSTKESGSFPSEEYRVFFQSAGKEISPWHDVECWADKEKSIVNAVIEITKNTRPKMEVATKESKNPIKQDMKKGKLRDYPLDIFWNYGMIPQTWENPKAEHPELKAFGDDDPVDVVEIGSEPIKRGEIVQVKAIGTLAMIDEGELDWKVIGVSTKDPKADKINSVADMEKEFPGQIDEIREWFRNYKSDGKFEGGKWTGITEGQNSFGLDEKCMDVEYTKKVIEETQEQYLALKTGKIDNDGLSLE